MDIPEKKMALPSQDEVVALSPFHYTNVDSASL
jgi:hypothetical protein